MPVRSPETIDAIRAVYESGNAATRVLATMFGVTKGEIFALARQHGWARRADTLATTTARERAIAVRAAEAAHQASLYRAAVDDVALLRRRGYVVTREQDKVLVGNKLCTFEHMRSRAERERRLMAAAMMD